jgi:hypothetical protein
MEEPPGRHTIARANRSTRFTDEATIAPRLAPAPARAIIALGIGCVLFGGLFFGVKHSGHDVVATVTHAACADVCTVHVVYDAGGRRSLR